MFVPPLVIELRASPPTPTSWVPVIPVAPRSAYEPTAVLPPMAESYSSAFSPIAVSVDVFLLMLCNAPAPTAVFPGPANPANGPVETAVSPSALL
jgi:hypothetical protein